MRTFITALALTVCLPSLALAAPDATDSGGHRICFSPTQIRETKVISDREILFRMYGGQYYMNTLAVDCPGLKIEGGFRWTLRGEQVCSNSEIIYVVRRGNACPLGAFTAYTPPPKPAE